MKIYILTSGGYSDYRVNGVFSDLEKAEYAKRLLMGDEIDEWEVDEIPEHPPGLLRFWVRMNVDGNEVYSGQHANFTGPDWEPGKFQKFVVFHMWASDEEHAIKIANERRLSLKASGQLTDDWAEFEARKK